MPAPHQHGLERVREHELGPARKPGAVQRGERLALFAVQALERIPAPTEARASGEGRSFLTSEQPDDVREEREEHTLPGVRHHERYGALPDICALEAVDRSHTATAATGHVSVSRRGTVHLRRQLLHVPR
jgi:hypothetical protein